LTRTGSIILNSFFTVRHNVVPVIISMIVTEEASMIREDQMIRIIVMRGNLHTIGTIIVVGVHIGKMSAVQRVIHPPTRIITKNFVVGKRIKHKPYVGVVMITTYKDTMIRVMTGT